MAIPPEIIEEGQKYRYIHSSKQINEIVSVENITRDQKINKHGASYEKRSLQVKRPSGEVIYVGASKLHSLETRPELSLLNGENPPQEVEEARVNMDDKLWEQIGASAQTPARASDFSHYAGSEKELVFANKSELLFAQKLDSAGLRWDHEPKLFNFERPEGSKKPTGFLPDFYLTDQDLYIELTAAQSGDKSGKNVKLRSMADQHPKERVLILTRDSFAAMIASKDPLSLARKIYTHQELRFFSKAPVSVYKQRPLVEIDPAPAANLGR